MALIESLESRTLMSTTFIYNPATTTERLQIGVDVAKTALDNADFALTINVDRLTFAGSGVRTNSTLEPLFAKLGSDLASGKLTLANEAQTAYAQYVSDNAVVVADEVTLSHGGSLADINAAAVALVHAQITMETDLVTNADIRVADREALTTAVASDAHAIEVAMPGAGINSTVQSNVTKWLTDYNTGLTTGTTDLQKVVSDRNTLIADMNSELS